MPTALPAGGGSQAATADPPVAAQVVCSAVPDGVLRHLLAGPFLAYTNPQGECHINRAGLREPLHGITLVTSLTRLPITNYRATAGSEWHQFRVKARRLAGYIQVWNDVRWYRVALEADPTAPGTLLVSCSYIKFVDMHTTRTVPAPMGFWAAADAYVVALTDYLIK